ncbi:MAG: hypothetical protein ACRD2K_04530 [Terriglobales bacterium]
MAYESGQLIEHPKWGRGKIVQVDGDKVRVIFKSEPQPKLIDTARFPLPLAENQRDPYFGRIHLPATSGKGRGAGGVKSTITHAEAKRRFLAKFPLGFADSAYQVAERNSKVEASERWAREMSREELERLLAAGEFAEVAQRAMQIEAQTNLLDVFAKAALRNAAKAEPEAFARGLFELVCGEGEMPDRFEGFAAMLDSLPQPKTQTFKWPIQTIFPFLADPREHLFLKPKVTQLAADRFGFDLQYRPQPAWDVYARVLEFARQLAQDLADLKPADLIDIQAFLYLSGRMEEE